MTPADQTAKKRRCALSLALVILGFVKPLYAESDVESDAESAFGETHGTVDRIEPRRTSNSGDGVYGRFNGDMSLQIGAGAEGDLSAGAFRPLLIGDVTVYQTVGVYGSYRHAVSPGDPLERALSLGVGVSPLFLLRFSRSWETGAAVWDLSLDSLTLTAGAALAQPDGGSLLDEFGAELGLQLGLPLMGRANGLWLRGRGQLTTGQELGGAAWLWLSYQGFFHAGVLRVN